MGLAFGIDLMEIRAVGQKDAIDELDKLNVWSKLERIEDSTYSSSVNSLARAVGYETRDEREAFRELIIASKQFRLVNREYKGHTYSALLGYKVV